MSRGSVMVTLLPVVLASLLLSTILRALGTGYIASAGLSALAGAIAGVVLMRKRNIL